MKVSEVNKILKDKNKQDMETNFKLKVKKTPGGPGNPRKPPKYFTDFKDEMLDFIKEQRAFNQQMLDFVKRQEKNWEEQRKFNESMIEFKNYVLGVFKRNNLK